MANNTHQQQLIEGLRQDAEKGQNGASLEVQSTLAPSTSNDHNHHMPSASPTSFFFHPAVAARTSGHFERFPEPAVIGPGLGCVFNGSSTMANSTYQQQLLKGLLQDAEKGQNGASLEVQSTLAPSTSTDHNHHKPSASPSFFFHPAIAAGTSGYFERFPEPAVIGPGLGCVFNGSSTMANNTYQQQLIEGLLQDAEKGQNGASLEVQCTPAPSTSNDHHHRKPSASPTSLFLHPAIAARTSGYFERFPEPEQRQINEINATTFVECRKFMYLGACTVTHESVAALLAAADLLVIKGLGDACFAYLECNLDHSNYHTVQDLAERFHRPQLAQTALRFAGASAAKSELVVKKRRLASQIQENDKSIEQANSTKLSLSHELERLEEQWTVVLQKDIDSAVPPPREGGKEATDDVASYPYVKAKPLGAVGRLVVDPQQYSLCRGVTKYDPLAVPAKKKECTRDDDWDYDGNSSEDSCDPSYGQPPPPPTRKQYEDLDILYAHSSLKEALKDAKPGDRIYLSEGTYDSQASAAEPINQSVEIVALPGEEVVLQSCGDTIFEVYNGSVRLSGLKFQYQPEGSRDKCPFVHVESQKGDVFIQDCMFDMGTNVAEALPSRVSGIFLMQGESARIEGNKFIGGGGSAVTVLNDPTLRFTTVRLIRNVFVNTGQPSFSERRVVKTWNFPTSKREETPLPEDEIVPGPAAVELWRFNRECYRSRTTRKWERYQTTTVVISENRFCQNMRAALAYRSLSGSEKDGFEIYGSRRPKPKPTIQLYTNITSIDCPTPGFKIALTDNVLENNGLEFDSQQVASWIKDHDSISRSAKKVCVENDGEGGAMACASTIGTPVIPDGDSLLTITQIIESYADNFPRNFEHSLPYEGFDDEFFTPEI